jgi:sugar fermentation stimulation protein A
MNLEPALQEAVLIRRYKRFLADVELPDGNKITIHCPNTGSMLNCCSPGSRIWYSTSNNPKRKYPNTWEIVENESKHLVGVNTSRANDLVDEALHSGLIPELAGYSNIKREVPFGEERSRIDFLLSLNKDKSIEDCYLEVKNVSLGVENSLAIFPDAVTTRGQKHLRELIEMKAQNKRAVLLFCIQHTGIERFEPADSIDPEYGRLLRKAKSSGVELLAYSARIKPDEISLRQQVSINLP